MVAGVESNRNKGTRIGVSLVLAACILASAPHSAQARDMTGKAGFGFSARLDEGFAQIPALTFRYWRRSLAFEAIGGFDWDVVDGELDDTRRLHAGAGALWLVNATQHMNVTLGGRLYMQVTLRDIEQEAVRVTVDKTGQTEVLDKLHDEGCTVGVLLALPLQVEHFLSDHSSLTASVALTVASSSSCDTSTTTKTAIDRPFRDLSGATLQLAGRYSGGLGYTYYF